MYTLILIDFFRFCVELLVLQWALLFFISVHKPLLRAVKWLRKFHVAYRLEIQYRLYFKRAIFEFHSSLKTLYSKTRKSIN